MSKKEPYTYAEKLALIGQGLMDPAELGVLPIAGERAENTAGGKVVNGPKTKPELGDYIVFQASVVPLDLRAEWARMEAKILPFDKEAWKKEHEKEFVIQAKFQCGTAAGVVEGTFTDKILGLTNLLNAAAEQLKAFYENEKNSKKEIVA